MTDPTQAAAGTRETQAEETKTDGSTVRLWLDALSLSSTEEENWRKDAQEALDLYRQTRGKQNEKSKDEAFNILHANVETLKPALYNSTPIPDVRRRYGDPDPVAKTVADVQERCLSYSVESYDFDHTMKLAVSDNEIVGRAITRARYKPYLDKDEKIAYQEVTCEPVAWNRFRHGPAEVWDDVPWIAFELLLTRDELIKLSPKYGGQVTLDVTINDKYGKDDARNIPEVFKRARVWEIWDKDSRKVLFIAESFKEAPIREESDPLDLEGFWPIPRPLYAVETSTSLVPVVPYTMYKAQAKELELVSKRIIVLTEAVKAKALYDARITEMDRLENAEDADNIPIENVSIFADGSKLADHVMWYPIDVLSAALEKLYIARDQIKQTIYEITGIADILRGDTDPNETLGAQQIKTQWGSLRIQNKQQEVARFARDLFRIKAELFASKFEPNVLEMMTGIPLTPQEGEDQQTAVMKAQVLQLLRTDKLRSFRIDVESDSTIRADMTRNQQNMSLFLQGTAQFAQSMGPIVMADQSMKPAAIEVYAAFARNFKLGRQAEDALEKVSQSAQEAAKQPPQPDPAQQAEQAKLAMEREKHQMEMQGKQAELDGKLQLMQAQMQMKREELQLKREEMDMRREEMALEMQAHQQKMSIDAELAQKKAAVQSQAIDHEAMLNERTAELQREGAEMKHEMGMEMMAEKAKQAKAKPNGARK